MLIILLALGMFALVNKVRAASVTRDSVSAVRGALACLEASGTRTLPNPYVNYEKVTGETALHLGCWPSNYKPGEIYEPWNTFNDPRVTYQRGITYRIMLDPYRMNGSYHVMLESIPRYACRSLAIALVRQYPGFAVRAMNSQSGLTGYGGSFGAMNRRDQWDDTLAGIDSVCGNPGTAKFSMEFNDHNGGGRAGYGTF